MVRDSLELPGLEIPLDSEAFSRTWDQALRRLRTPLTSTNLVAWWLLCGAAAREGWLLALSGEGADGWFSGGLYDGEREVLARLAASDPEAAARQVLLCRTHCLNDPLLVARITTLPLDLSPRRRMWEACVDRAAAGSLDDAAILYHVRTAGQRLLTRADLVASAHGIRLALPFLEDGWLRWVRSIPYQARNRDGVRKAPLKALCQERWGRDMAHRPKIGFPFPLRTWIRDGQVPLLASWRGLLLEPRTLRREIYRRRALEPEIRSRLEGRARPADWLLWSLLNVELWLRTLNE
jgi:asparagine synthetase B (glutamine-hydrolysing)